MSQTIPFPGTRAGGSDGVAAEQLSIGEYLIRRLQEYGLRDVFGIPGDYVLGFYSLLEKSPIRVIGCTREDCAGFAADAYARVNGLGAVCVTYWRPEPVQLGGRGLCGEVAGGGDHRIARNGRAVQ
jgi:indolepyruvate decarboxylase